MINMKTFEMEDLNKFDSKFKFEDLERDMKRNIMDLSKTMLSLIWKGDTLAIVGVNEHRKGAGELWLLPSKNVDKCKLSFFKTVKALIYGYVFKELGYHRLEIAIEDGWEKGMKWAQALGFRVSHFCEAYDKDYRNHIIFCKVRPWQLAQQ